MIAGPLLLLRLPAGPLLCALLVACGGAAEEPSTASPTGTSPTPASTRTVTATPTSTPTPTPTPTPTSTPAPTPTPTSTPTPTPAPTPAPRPSERPATPPATATPSVPPAVLVPAFPGLPEPQRPIALIDVPEHDLFLIVLQEGWVVAVPRDGPYDNPHTVHDQRQDTACCGEEGLLSIALDPDFARNGYAYAYYSTGTLRRVTRLSRLATTGQGETFAFDASSELVLFEVAQPYVNHNGGTILFGPDGMLYLGFGDGGNANDPFRHGQNLTTFLGAIIRIDVRDASPDQRYATPPDNPFVGRAGIRPEIWAYGLRNPWRMSFDSRDRPPLGRRRGPEPRRGDQRHRGRRELRLERHGGLALLLPAPRGATAPVSPCLSGSTPTPSAAPSPAATSTAVRRSPPCAVGTSTATTATASSGRLRPRPPSPAASSSRCSSGPEAPTPSPPSPRTPRASST